MSVPIGDVCREVIFHSMYPICTRPRLKRCPSLTLLLAGASLRSPLMGIVERELVEVRAERVPHGMRGLIAHGCADGRVKLPFFTPIHRLRHPSQWHVKPCVSFTEITSIASNLENLILITEKGVAIVLLPFFWFLLCCQFRRHNHRPNEGI